MASEFSGGHLSVCEVCREQTPKFSCDDSLLGHLVCPSCFSQRDPSYWRNRFAPPKCPKCQEPGYCTYVLAGGAMEYINVYSFKCSKPECSYSDEVVKDAGRELGDVSDTYCPYCGAACYQHSIVEKARAIGRHSAE